MKGGRFTNTSENGGYLTVGGSGSSANRGDLYLFSNNGGSFDDVEVFRIYDTIGGVSLFGYYGHFLTVGSIEEPEDVYTANVYAYGNWDFRNASVTGLNSTAVFG